MSKTLRMLQIDAFTREVFRGNPAAICPLDEWLDDATMQAIAAENNLAETAFFVPLETAGEYHLRWFTPRAEIELCGHATLGSAFVIFNELQPELDRVRFNTLSGWLTVTRGGANNSENNAAAAPGGELLTMDFPAWRSTPCAQPPDALLDGLGFAPEEIFTAQGNTNYYVVLRDAAAVRELRPDLSRWETLAPYAVAVTAGGGQTTIDSNAPDFISRYFAPSYGVPEDPVTGSTHSALVPFWAERLGKTKLRAHQASARGGELLCELRGERITIAGYAVKYLDGTIWI